MRQRQEAGVETATGRVFVGHGRRRLTQVVDFHDNFRKFGFVFGLSGAALIATAPPSSKRQEMFQDSRRCGVFVGGQPSWRVQSHPVKANQTFF
jgi:hypothetical protein